MPGVVDRLASATPDWLLAATPPGIAALVVATLIGAEPAGSPLRSVARVACPLGLAAYALTTFMLPRVAPCVLCARASPRRQSSLCARQ